MRALSFLVLASTLTSKVIGTPNADGTVAHVLECVSKTSDGGFQFNIIFSDVQEVSLSSICKNFATDGRSSFNVAINCAAETKGRLVQIGIDLPAKFAGSQLEGYNVVASQFSHTMQGPVTDFQTKDGSRVCFNNDEETNLPTASLNLLDNSTDATGQTSKRYVMDSEIDFGLRARGSVLPRQVQGPAPRPLRRIIPYRPLQVAFIAGREFRVKSVNLARWLIDAPVDLFPPVLPGPDAVTTETLQIAADNMGSLNRVDLVASFDTGGITQAPDIKPEDWIEVLLRMSDTIIDAYNTVPATEVFNSVVVEFANKGDPAIGPPAIHAQLGWVAGEILETT
ncbi:hypothetical protein LTR56_009978 [Elasticomyces elasticus]|nr:hypothetical protein LTR56_009978 [Elasticomyces elasticus]KAK3656173.1 hypothetical protein LTR22_009880 [Elasticomyces elasticus]KAK5756518.1 hypothetical protein LTS12_013353 [Elasticomyces elasticus]